MDNIGVCKALFKVDDICVKNLKLKNGSNVRNNYTVNSKLALSRKIFKRYLNIIMEDLVDGNAVLLNDKVYFNVMKMDYTYSPYDTVKEELNSKQQMPYIIFNTGNRYKNNRDFLVIPSKSIKKKLYKRLGLGKTFTSIIKWAYL